MNLKTHYFYTLQCKLQEALRVPSDDLHWGKPHNERVRTHPNGWSLTWNTVHEPSGERFYINVDKRQGDALPVALVVNISPDDNEVEPTMVNVKSSTTFPCTSLSTHPSMLKSLLEFKEHQ